MEERHQCRRQILSTPETPSEKENVAQRRTTSSRLALLSEGPQSPKTLTPIDFEVDTVCDPSPKPYRRSSNTAKKIKQTLSLPIDDSVMREHNGVVMRRHHRDTNGTTSSHKRSESNRSRHGWVQFNWGVRYGLSYLEENRAKLRKIFDFIYLINIWNY